MWISNQVDVVVGKLNIDFGTLFLGELATNVTNGAMSGVGPASLKRCVSVPHHHR